MCLDVDASGASVGRIGIAGRLRQFASDARDDRTAVNGGNVRYHGEPVRYQGAGSVRYHGGSTAGGGTVVQASARRASDDWTSQSTAG